LICGIAPFVHWDAVLTVVQVSGGSNVAVTERDEFIVIEQAPLPAQAPDQPVNAPDVSEIANTETTVPWLYTAEQVAPQSIPAGFDVTVPPVPLPALLTVNVRGNSVKVAVTLLAAVIDTVQGAVPGQPLIDHPVNVEPLLGAAVSVTSRPSSKAAAHVGPQLIPAGLDVTVPAPLPSLLTVSVYWSVNVAVTALAAVTDTVQGAVPGQPLSDHPVNPEPAAGAAVSVTLCP
jgi:hypothetical protein